MNLDSTEQTKLGGKQLHIYNELQSNVTHQHTWWSNMRLQNETCNRSREHAIVQINLAGVALESRKRQYKHRQTGIDIIQGIQNLKQCNHAKNMSHGAMRAGGLWRR